jgi:hypothetical protein
MARAGLTLGLAVLLLFSSQPATAKIDLVTLPERGDIELTIYNNEDLTLVRERRTMSFTEGKNELQFGWANTLIDPTSLHLKVLDGDDFINVEDISYPPNTQNVLIWNIYADQAGTGKVEISYFTSGISWSADYVLKADKDEAKARLEGYVGVTNKSGEDYENATTRLLVGEINMVEKIAQLARAGIAGQRARQDVMRGAVAKAERRALFAGESVGAAPAALAMDQAKEVVKEGVSEYYLFTIEGKEDLTNGLNKRLPSFEADDVPIILTYKYDQRRYGNQIAKFYKLLNNEESELGDAPLPNGMYRVFRDTPDGSLSYEGAHSERYVPIGEELELNLGSDGLIVMEQEQMNFVRENLVFNSSNNVVGQETISDFDVTLRNSKTQQVPLEIRIHFSGDYDFTPTGSNRSDWNKINEFTWEIKADLNGMSSLSLPYSIRTRIGAASRK